MQMREEKIAKKIMHIKLEGKQPRGRPRSMSYFLYRSVTSNLGNLLT